MYKIKYPGSLKSLRYPTGSKIILTLSEIEELRATFGLLKIIARGEHAPDGDDGDGFKIGIL